jgi:hypothetical protein
MFTQISHTGFMAVRACMVIALNPAATVDAPIASLSAIVRQRRRATEQQRSAALLA